MGWFINNDVFGLGFDAAGEGGFGEHSVYDVFGDYLIVAWFHVVAGSALGDASELSGVAG